MLTFLEAFAVRWRLAILAGAISSGLGCAAPLTIRFSGRIESIDAGCAADGVCELVVSGRSICFGHGWSRSRWGKVDPDILELDSRSIGRAVEVYAQQLASGRDLTLEGDRRYYVRLQRERD